MLSGLALAWLFAISSPSPRVSGDVSNRQRHALTLKHFTGSLTSALSLRLSAVPRAVPRGREGWQLGEQSWPLGG